MKDWTEGYVADIGYTYGYYHELNPLRAQWAFLNSGLVPPKVPGNGFTACELGFGQGVSTVFHAAGSQAQWWGTDFNPSQAAYAMQLADMSGSGAKLYDEAFADFCARADLPDFDYIGLHGIWSWISDENRAVIVDFVRRKLKVGGVLYVSYNTQPGWSAAMPLRHLLTSHASVMGTEGQGILGRIGDSLAFAEKLMAANPAYVRANPNVVDRLNRIKGMDKSYLAHEYFNKDWAPMHFADMADWLAPAKVSYACSAHFLDHINGMNFSPEQQQILDATPAGVLRETVRDYCVNQQFRRDYWVKGPRQISPVEQGEAMRRERVVLVQPAPMVSLKVTGPSGEVTLKQDVYEALIKVMADHVPRTIEYIATQMAKHNLAPQTREAVTVLLGTGALQLCQDEKLAAKAKPQTDRLNEFLMKQARGGGLNYLVSPLVGGVVVSRAEQLFLAARSAGAKTPQEWAAYAWQQFNAVGQRLVKDGVTLETVEDNMQELTNQAMHLMTVRLPILRALMIA
jgi:SAM-dependent methyltransferase